MSSLNKVLSSSKCCSKTFGILPTYHKNMNNGVNHLHVSSNRRLPQAMLQLPHNVQDINASEVGQFSPQRARDINGPAIVSHKIQNESARGRIDITINSDPHVASYDCRGAVSLSSSMQSNVPSPFSGNQSHLGMPGSQWGQAEKYLSEHLRNSHYLMLRNMYREYHTSQKKPGTVISNKQHRTMCEAPRQLTMREKFKKTVKDYGATVIVFHITISLASLGICYTLVSSGLDLVSALKYFNLAEETLVQRLSNAGNFVVAYGVHKVFAPIRMGITMAVAPLLVKYLRKNKILK